MTSAPVPVTGQTAAAATAERMPSRSRGLFGRVLRSPGGLFGVVWLLIVAVCGFFAPWLAPLDPLQQDIANALSLPTAAHPLGTDTLGRDVLSRLMYGGSSILIGILIAIGVAVVLGLIGGVVAGYFGGVIDTAFSKVTDALLALPGIVIMLLVAAIFGTDLTPAMVALGILLSAQFFRLARIGTQQVRRELYIDASRVAGLSNVLIVARHVLPNMIRPIIVQASLTAAMVIFLQSGLAFLGLGPPPPSPQWGSLVQEASTQIYVFPWLMVPTGAVMILTALAFNLIGDTLTDSVSPLATKASSLGARVRRSRAAASPVFDDDAPLLEVEGLTIGFPRTDGDTLVVIQDVGLRVERGEVLALVGESGCGKTVTGLALAGLLPGNGRIVDGGIRYRGAEVARADESTWSRLRGSEIAFIAQEPMLALDPSFTIGSQLREPLRAVHGASASAAKARALDLLTKVGIADPVGVARKYPHQLSGGMAQRVAIAIALVGEPRLIIADEPTTALDVTIQSEVIELLREIVRDTGAALVIVTHDWGVVADVADRAIVMYAGEVVERADVDEIFPTPRHPYTAALLRSAPRVEHAGGVLPTIPGSVPPPAHWPTGCHFQNRCALATAGCVEAPIPLVQLSPSRTSRCIRIDELTRKVSA